MASTSFPALLIGRFGELVLKPLRGTSTVNSIVVSLDGKYIASGSHDRTICVWDAETGEAVLKSLYGHTDSVISVSFSPNGMCIASASFDGTIRLWDVSSNTNSTNSTMINNQILPVKFSSNPNHALPVVEDLLRGTDPGIAFSITEDGWILGPMDELLFWVPLEYRRGLWWPRTKVIVGSPITNIDLSRMVHGSSWSKCYPT
jgi:WD40 repeat protein